MTNTTSPHKTLTHQVEEALAAHNARPKLLPEVHAGIAEANRTLREKAPPSTDTLLKEAFDEAVTMEMERRMPDIVAAVAAQLRTAIPSAVLSQHQASGHEPPQEVETSMPARRSPHQSQPPPSLNANEPA